MAPQSYFSWQQMLFMLLMGMVGACLKAYAPFGDILVGQAHLPASAFAFKGWLVIILWLRLARIFVRLPYSELAQGIFLASMGWILAPGYGVMTYGIVSPIGFNLWLYLSIMTAAFLMGRGGQESGWRPVLWGAAANMALVIMIWAAPGCYLYRWVMYFAAASSGCLVAAGVLGGLGVLLAGMLASWTDTALAWVKHILDSR